MYLVIRQLIMGIAVIAGLACGVLATVHSKTSPVSRWWTATLFAGKPEKYPAAAGVSEGYIWYSNTEILGGQVLGFATLAFLYLTLLTLFCVVVYGLLIVISSMFERFIDAIQNKNAEKARREEEDQKTFLDKI